MKSRPFKTFFLSGCVLWLAATAAAQVAIKPFTVSMIHYLRAKHQIGTQYPNWPCGAQPGEPRGDGLYSVRSVALRLAVPIWKVHEWIQAGLVTASHRCQKAAWWIKLDDETMKRLEEQIRKARHKKVTGHV
jgi:hypothetical protein